MKDIRSFEWIFNRDSPVNCYSDEDEDDVRTKTNKSVLGVN